MRLTEQVEVVASHNLPFCALLLELSSKEDWEIISVLGRRGGSLSIVSISRERGVNMVAGELRLRDDSFIVVVVLECKYWFSTRVELVHVVDLGEVFVNGSFLFLFRKMNVMRLEWFLLVSFPNNECDASSEK